jgi:hypothetical protein
VKSCEEEYFFGVTEEGLQKIFQELTKEKFHILLYYDNNEVYQADTNIEVSCPTVLDGEKFHNGVGFLIENDAGETYFLAITKKGMETLERFYRFIKGKRM